MRIIALLFCCFLALAHLSGQNTPLEERSGALPTYLPDNWQNFTSIHGQFKVRIPGKFKEKVDTFETKIGQLVYHTFFYQDQSEGAENFVYMISYVDYPAEAVHSDSTEFLEEFFQATIDEATFSIDGELAYSNPIEEQGYPGFLWRINYRQNKGVVKTKALLKANRYYAIQAVTIKDLALDLAIDRFLDSFRILE